MDESTRSKIDDQWVSFFTKSLAGLAGEKVEDLRKGVERFEKVAAATGPVVSFKIEAAGGGRLMLATANTPVKVRISALNDRGVAVADFAGKVKLSATGKSLVPDPMETAAFVAGVLDNIELKFKTPNPKATLTADAAGIASGSQTFPVLGALATKPTDDGRAVVAKTQKARAILAQPPANPGSAALAELRARRPGGGLNSAPRQTEQAKAVGCFGSDEHENCGAATLGAICGMTTTELVDKLLRGKLEAAVREKVTKENPQLSGAPLDLKVQERLDATCNDYKTIQNQSVYWRAESLENLKYNFDEPKDGMPDNPKGEECGESQLAATRELLVAEAKRRNDEGGVGGVKYKVIQDGMNDSDPGMGKFYDLDAQALQKQMGKYPDGTQFQVFLTGPGFPGHWVYAEKYNGNVVIEDYQKAGDIGKKGATAYTDDDAPHSPTDDKAGVFEKGMFIALCPESADETAIGAWAENPKWPQGGVPSRVVDKPEAVADAPEIIAVPESEVTVAIEGGDLAARITDPGFRKGLLQFLDKPGAADDGLSKKLLAGFRAAPEGDSEVREKIFKKAFSCNLSAKLDGKKGAVPAKVLTKMVDILETLPRDHLPANWDLEGSNGTSKTSGSWDPDGKKATFEYGADDAPAFDQNYDNAEPGDALEGTKCFDVMVRHEVGHAVHTDKGGNALTDGPDGGSWRKHGAFLNVLGELPDLLSGFAGALQIALGLPAKPDPGLIKTQIGGAGESNLKDEDKLRKALGSALSGLAGITYPQTVVGLAQKQEYVSSRLPMDHDLIQVVLQGARPMPYFALGASPLAVGGRVYLNAENADGWVSFAAASYASRISMYQYRSPGEWFAEFYAGVNNGEAGVRRKVASQYPGAHSWLKREKLLLHPNE